MADAHAQCSESGLLRYKTQEANTLALSIPEDAATNKAEVAAYKVRPLLADPAHMMTSLTLPLS